jgi:hypothetical protein
MKSQSARLSNGTEYFCCRQLTTNFARDARMADRHPEYLILRCPTDCPENCVNRRSNEFGSWVQIDTLVGNPFMGTASPHCGARIQ